MDQTHNEMKNPKRVRFSTVEIGQYFETEYKEVCLKTDQVRIVADGDINFRNAFCFNTKKLIPCDSAQWVWIDAAEQTPAADD